MSDFRYLTAGEISMLAGIYGNTIDYGSVKIYRGVNALMERVADHGTRKTGP